MINIKDFIDNIFFIMFKRYIFKNNYKKNTNFEHFPENLKNENEDDYEEVWFLRDLRE